MSAPAPATVPPRTPSTTVAAVLHAAGDIRLDTVPLRPLRPTDALVEMRSGGICGSDMHYFTEGRNGTNVLRQPTVLGHEGAGVVVAAGPEAGLAEGTPVAVEPARPCGHCAACRAGRYNVCPTGVCFGSPPTDGIFARHVVVPADQLHVLPAAVPVELGAAIEPLAVAVWAVRRAEVRAGDRVLVTGAGPIGALVSQVALSYGAAEVVVTDVNDDRLALAAAAGATRTINTAGSELDVTEVDRLIECSGVPAALVAAIPTVRPAGRITVVGQARPSVDGLPLGFLQRYEIDLVTAFRYASAFPEAIDLAARGTIDLARIVTARFPLEDVAAALRAPVSDPTNLKVLLTY
jgi:L-iditol 2-dehydrogenase